MSTNGQCPVCGGADHQVVVARNRLQVVRCRACGHQFVWPVPSVAELTAIYDEGYYQGGHGSVGFRDYGGLSMARRRMYQRHLDRLERFIDRGRLLDVGCATGDFLQVARARGWDSVGVDPSPARDQAIAAGLTIVGRTLEDAALGRGSVVAITFWDVLEHLGDPTEALRQAARLLRPGGVAAATVPNAASALARLSGHRWFGYKTAGEHLQFFKPSSIAAAFRAAGLDIVVQQPVAWSCTVGFVADRASLYLGTPGVLANRALRSSPLASLVIDVPLVNQLVIARRPKVGSRAA